MELYESLRRARRDAARRPAGARRRRSWRLCDDRTAAAGAEGSREFNGLGARRTGGSRENPIGAYLGGGFSYGVEGNRAGIAVAHPRIGQPGFDALADQGANPHRAETSIELTYQRKLADWLRVQPDAQYVLHPSWRSDIGDALVLGLRLIFATP